MIEGGANLRFRGGSNGNGTRSLACQIPAAAIDDGGSLTTGLPEILTFGADPTRAVCNLFVDVSKDTQTSGFGSSMPAGYRELRRCG